MLRDSQERDKQHETFETWVQNNLQELSVSPRDTYVDDSLPSLLLSLQEERGKHRKRRWLRRSLEGMGAVAAAALLLLAIPQLGGLPQQEFAGEPAGNQESAADSQESAGEDLRSFSVQSEDEGLERAAPSAETQEQADAASAVLHENQAFQVEVPAPLTVGDGFELSGQARVFEAAFNYEVEDGHNVLASGFVQADQGAPEWGSFTLEVQLERAPTSPNGTLILYESSAQDGSRVNQLYIPLQFVQEQVE